MIHEPQGFVSRCRRITADVADLYLLSRRPLDARPRKEGDPRACSARCQRVIPVVQGRCGTDQSCGTVATGWHLPGRRALCEYSRWDEAAVATVPARPRPGSKRTRAAACHEAAVLRHPICEEAVKLGPSLGKPRRVRPIENGGPVVADEIGCRLLDRRLKHSPPPGAAGQPPDLL